MLGRNRAVKMLFAGLVSVLLATAAVTFTGCPEEPAPLDPDDPIDPVEPEEPIDPEPVEPEEDEELPEPEDDEY